MVTDKQRRLILRLLRLRLFTYRKHIFGLPEVHARRGFGWLRERLLAAQQVDDLHHAPACPANHYHKRRFVFSPCTCGASRTSQGKEVKS